jgi:hypothetical protein
MALAGIPDLLEIAWTIKESDLDQQQARDAFFGYGLDR